MRVIAGTSGGLALKSPGSGTRPTMDRVRAAIFSSLGDLVPGSRVLDLFAGSGSLGIEALSRGAASAVFVEHHGPTASVIRSNLRSTSLCGSVQQMDVFRFLELYAEPGSRDLVFADPPYLKEKASSAGAERENAADMLLRHPGLPVILGAGGILILECERRQPLPSLDTWKVLSDRSYGESRILVLRGPVPAGEGKATGDMR